MDLGTCVSFMGAQRDAGKPAWAGGHSGLLCERQLLGVLDTTYTGLYKGNRLSFHRIHRHYFYTYQVRGPTRNSKSISRNI